MNLKLKTYIEGSMKSIGTYKHAVNKLNMRQIQVWTKQVVQAQIIDSRD